MPKPKRKSAALEDPETIEDPPAPPPAPAASAPQTGRAALWAALAGKPPAPAAKIAAPPATSKAAPRPITRELARSCLCASDLAIARAAGDLKPAARRLSALTSAPLAECLAAVRSAKG